MNLEGDHLTRLIQGHRAVDNFNYSLVVEWAMKYVISGMETEYMLILASFSVPVQAEEIKPFIHGALTEIELEELQGEEAILACCHYYVEQVLRLEDIRSPIGRLYYLCLEFDYAYGLGVFYNLFWSLDAFDYGDSFSWYYDGLTERNFDSVAKLEAENWINKWIHGLAIQEINIKQDPRIITMPKSLWGKVRSFLFPSY